MSLSHGLCLLDRLIDSSRLRDSIHEKYLVEGNSEDIQNGRFCLVERKANELSDNPVKSKSKPKNPLDQVNDKSPISSGYLRIPLNSALKVSLWKTGIMIQAVQHCKCQVSSHH